MTLTQDASKGGVPEQRLLKKTLVNEGGGTIYTYIYIYIGAGILGYYTMLGFSDSYFGSILRL